MLGARDSNDYGCLLVYDKDTLEPYKTIYSEKNLGFMWECPDYFEVDGKEIFMFSPQGISRMYPNLKYVSNRIFSCRRRNRECRKNK